MSPFVFFLSKGNTASLPALLVIDNNNEYQFLRVLQSAGNYNFSTTDTEDSVGGITTLNGTAGLADGNFGEAFDFDGTAGGFAEVSGESNLSTTDFTIAAWINPANVTGLKTIVASQGYETATASSWKLLLNGANLEFRYYDGASETTVLTGGVNLVSSVFSQIIVTRRNNNLYFYVEGTLDTNVAFSADLTDATGFDISANTNPFNGLIDDLLLIKGASIVVANNPAIETLQPKDYDPSLNNIKFQLTGQIQYNYYGSLSTNNLDNLLLKSLTVAGTPTLDNTTVKFTSNRTILFNNTDQQITIPTSVDFGFGTGDFSVQFQVRFSSLTGTQDLLRIGNIRIYQTSNTIRFNDGTADRITSGIGNTIWYHVLLSRSSGTSQLFIDGTSVGSYVDANDYGSTNTLLISNSSTNAFSGNIDQIQVSTNAIAINVSSPQVPLYNPQKNPTGSDRSRTVFWLDAGDYETVEDVTSDRLGSTLTTTNISLGQNFSFTQGKIVTNLNLQSLNNDNWTTEGYFYIDPVWLTNNKFLQFITVEGNSNNNTLRIDKNRSGSSQKLRLLVGTTSTTPVVLIIGTTNLESKWYHIAATRNGNVYSLFLNGVLEGTDTASTSPGLPTDAILKIGTSNIVTSLFPTFASDFIGQVTGVKFHNYSKYTFNFSIYPDNPLETDHYSTDLLVTADNTYGSTFNWDRTGKALTNTNTTVVTDSDFFYGKAISFDGTTSYIDVENKPANYSGDFSIEFELEPDSLTGSKELLRGDNYLIQLVGSTLQLESPVATSLISTTITSGRKRVFIGRRSGQLQLVIEGTFVTPVTNSTSLNHQTTLKIGETLAGKLSSLRMKSKYLEPSWNQPPPLPSDPYINNVSLLLPGIGVNGGTSFLELNGITITANGGITTSTVQSKFNGSSIITDGTDDYLSIPNSSAFDFGIGSATVEGWWRFTNLSGSPQNYLYSFGTNWSIYVTSAGSVVLFDGSSIAATSTGVITTNTWYHIAIVKDVDSAIIFVNGVNSATGTWTTATTPTGALTIAGLAASGYTTGYSQWHRITNIARYIESFPAPTQPFPTR